MRTPEMSSGLLAGCQIGYERAIVRAGSPGNVQAGKRRSVGFVYVLSNAAIPGMVKVGYTTDLVEDRARKLHTTGVPVPYDIKFGALTSFPREVEGAAHAMLEPHRVNKKREFYRVSPEFAIQAVKDALLDAASIEQWNFEAPHRLRCGDRVALTAMKDDIFVLLARPHLWALTVKPIDVWQSHADGDLLEVMGADPAYVAGLSDYELEAEQDPVPFLDRAEQCPNGIMNGRERLVPGDRLLWLRPVVQGEACLLAIFEADAYCQVVSRTWEPQVDPSGHLQLLQALAVDQFPVGVVRAAQAVMRMPAPRTWAPRNPEPDEGWVQTAVIDAPPDYWLAQLAKQRRSATHPGRDSKSLP